MRTQKWVGVNMNTLRNRIIFSLVIATIIIAAIIVLVMPSGKKEPPVVVSHAESSSVILTNAQAFSSWLDAEQIPDIEKDLYKRVAKYTTSPEATYDGTIRRESFKTVHNDYDDNGTTVSVPSTTYIVDIPGAQQSYVVSFSGGDEYPYRILYVTCVKADQLKYGDFGCTDESS